MSASAIKVGEKSQGGEGGRDHWGGSEEELLERNMGKFKFWGGHAIFSRGTGRWHSLEGPNFLTEPLPGTGNHQDKNDARRGVVGENADNDYDDYDHYRENKRGRRVRGGPQEL